MRRSNATWPTIGLALEVLADRPRSRRRARLLAVYDARSTMIAEVLSTQYGPVVVMQHSSARRRRPHPAGPQARRAAAHRRPLTSWFVVTTRHGQYVLRAEELIACIRDGTTTFVLGRTAPR